MKASSTLSLVKFLRVSSNTQKIEKLLSVIENHFAKTEKILIVVPNQEAADFLDQLLWKNPIESFLPHTISNQDSQDPIVITTLIKNINSAVIIINLHQDPAFSLNENSRCIYELLDEMHPEKKAFSLDKYKMYESRGYAVQIID